MALRYVLLNAKPPLNRVGWNEGFRQGSDTLSRLVYFIFIYLGCNSLGSYCQICLFTPIAVIMNIHSAVA